MTPSKAEARLAIARTVVDTLLDLGGEEITPEEENFLTEAYADAAELLLEALGLDVIGVDGEGRITCVLALPSI